MSDAQETYSLNRSILSNYIMYAGSLYGLNDGEWLPSQPLDVDARVYVELGEREFSKWDEDSTLLLADFIAELQALAAKAPKKAEVVIELCASSEYDESTATPRYEVGYFRDPTKRERAEREETNRKIAARDAEQAERAVQKERAEFERLKAKFVRDTNTNRNGEVDG